MEYYCKQCGKHVKTGETPAGGGRHCRECGSLIIDGSIAPGSMIAGFKIIHEISRGNNGIVYLARQTNLERDVALKVLTDDKAADSEFIEYFFHEARAAAALNHPAIVQAYDAGVTPEGIYYFAMELIDGDTAESLLEQNGTFTPERVLDIAIAIAEALEYAWDRQRLTHGDIKPENIVFNRHGEAKLADLGLAKIAFDHSNETEIMATPLYAAPEVIRGEKENIGIKSDMYAFGIVLYQMLCGRPPYDEDDPNIVMSMHLNNKHVPLKEINSELSHLSVISDFIDRMISKNMESRPQSWGEIVGFLKMVKANKHLYEPATEQHRLAVLLRQHPVIISLGSALVALIIIIAVIYLAVGKRTAPKPKGNAPAIVKNQGPGPKTEEKWSILKNSLKYMRNSDAASAIRQFIDANSSSGNLPDEAKSMLQQYVGQAAEEAAREAAIFTAKANVSEEIKSIDRTLLEARNLNDKQYKIQDIVNRIDALMMQYQSGEIPENSVSPATVKRLTEERNTLLKRLIIFHKADREQRVDTLCDAIRRDSKATKNSTPVLNLPVNNDFNLYFELLNDFMEMPESKRNTTWFQKIAEDYTGKIKSREIKQRILFLSGNLPDENSAAQMLQKFSSRLSGKMLPWKLDSSDKEYTLIACDSNGLTLIHNISDGVAERKKLPWSKISLQQQAALLQQWIIASDIPIPPDDFYVFAGVMVAQKNNDGLSALFNRFAGVNGVNLAQWQACHRDFKICGQEVAARPIALKILDLGKKDELSVALHEYLYKFAKFSKTDTYSRYKPIFEAMIEPYLRSQPEARAEMSEARLSALAEDDYPAALDLSCSAREFYASLKSVPEAQREVLNTTRKDVLRRWDAVQITLPVLPGYNLPPGVFWKQVQAARKSFPPNVAVIAQTAAAMSLGDMFTASRNIKQKTSIASVNLAPAEWQCPLLFYTVAVAGIFEQQELRDDALAMMRLAAKKNTTAFSWAMRAALTTREIQMAARLIPELTFNSQPGTSDLQAALLSLLAELQRESCYSQRFNTMSVRYAKFLRQQLAATDAKWLEVINKIVDDQENINSELETLKGKKPEEAELFGLLLADATARRSLTLNDINLSTVVEIIESLKPSSESSELWYRLQLLKMSAPGTTPKKFEQLTVTASSDCHIAAIPYYPRIINLMVSAWILNKSIPVSDAANTVRRFLDTAPMLSPSDEKIPKLLNSPKLPELFQEIITKFGMDETLFSSGCLVASITAANHQINESRTVINQMEQGQLSLIWQERLLLRTISDIIEAQTRMETTR